MDPSEIADLFFGPEDTANAKAQAMANALRGQQQLGQLGMLTGDKVLGGVGKQLFANAGEQQDYIPKAANMRLQRAMEAEKARREQEFQQAQMAHMTKQDALAQTQAAQGHFTLSNPTPTSPGYVVDNRTGRARPLLDAAPGKPESAGKDAKDLDKALRTLREDIDPTIGRGLSVFGKDASLSNAADRLLLLTHPNGPDAPPNYKLTVTQVPEMVQSVAGMLSSGNQAAQAQMEHLMPHTAGMSLAQKLEWLTGHPQDANVEEFVKQYAETAQREKAGAQQRIREGQLKRLPFHQGNFGRFPAEFKAAARGYLSDLSDDDLGQAYLGKYQPRPKGGGQGGGSWSADDEARLQQLEALEKAGKK